MTAARPSRPIRLHGFALSGHCHRVELFLRLLDLPFEVVPVDLARGEQRRPEFLALNAFGQVPVIDDDGVVVADSNAILVYLALRYAAPSWLPRDPQGAAAVQRWLSVAAGQIAFGPAAARLVTLFGAKFNAEDVIGRAHAVLKVIDEALADRKWIAAAQPTIADVALYSYIARAPEGNVDLSAYRNVNAWLGRIEALPGFVAFQKSPVGLAA